MGNQQIAVTSAPWTSITRLRDACIDWWAKHTVLDLAVTVAVIAIHWTMVYRGKFGDVLAWSGVTGQTATFAAGAGMMSLIAGFAGIGIAQYGSAPGDVMDNIRRTQGKEIRRNWLDITSWLLIGAVLCIIALSIDTHARGPARWVFEVAFVVAVMKFFRLIILFRLILAATDRQAAKSPDRRPIRMLEP